MLLYISSYFLIGIIFNILVDLAYDRMEWHGHEFKDNEKWDNFTKTLVLFLWPLALIVIAIIIIKNLRNG